jgi:energy-coupling factor transport system ATP-binding protein
VAIVGANGSGKTTLVRHFNGLLRPTSGVVRIGDWRTSDHLVSRLAARVGYVFQNPDDQLFKSSVRQEIAFGPTNLLQYPQTDRKKEKSGISTPPAARSVYQGKSKMSSDFAPGMSLEQVEKRVAFALEMFGFKERAEDNPADLSFPLRKLVAFASVVAMDTPILVLDEPTTGQDARTVRLLAQVVQELHREGKTIIAISHDMEFVAEYFERVVVMDQGKILLDGTPQEVFSQEEALRDTAVYAPQLRRLGQRLGIKRFVCTPDDFMRELAAQKAARSGTSTSS